MSNLIATQELGPKYKNKPRPFVRLTPQQRLEEIKEARKLKKNVSVFTLIRSIK